MIARSIFSLFLLSAASGLAADGMVAGPEPFRMAFTSNMFTEVSLSDARAAMKVWMMTVARERHIAIDPEPNIFSSVGEVVRTEAERQVDGCGLTTVEYAELARSERCDEFAISTAGGTEREKYVVIVQDDDPIDRLEDLENATLNVLVNPRMSLALIWLDVEFMQLGKPVARSFVGSINPCSKATQTVLPVYFGKATAALITRHSLDTMIELNPELGRKLRVLATSPDVIPSGFAFLGHRNRIDRQQLLDALAHMGDTTAGRQILTLTKADGIELRPISCLDDSLALLARHEELSKLAEERPDTGTPP